MFNLDTAFFLFLWTYLKKLLSVRGVHIRLHQKHWTIYTVTIKIFVELENDVTEIDLVKNILSESIYNSNIVGTNESSPKMVEKKTAHNVAMHLKNGEDTFHVILEGAGRTSKTNAIKLPMSRDFLKYKNCVFVTFSLWKMLIVNFSTK